MKEGSLTTSAEQVFIANVQMKVVDTDSALLDMGLLLLSISIVLNIPLALVRAFVNLHCVGYHFRIQGRHAAVDTVCGCREGVGGSG